MRFRNPFAKAPPIDDDDEEENGDTAELALEATRKAASSTVELDAAVLRLAAAGE